MAARTSDGEMNCCWYYGFCESSPICFGAAKEHNLHLAAGTSLPALHKILGGVKMHLAGGGQMADRRIYAGYYRRYDGKVVYVVTIAKDADTDEDTVIWTPNVYSEKRTYYTLSKRSFCESILFPESTADILRKRQKATPSEWIFFNPLRPEHPVAPDAAYRRLKALLKQAGLPDIRFHNLRHTFATHALVYGDRIFEKTG